MNVDRPLANALESALNNSGCERDIWENVANGEPCAVLFCRDNTQPAVLDPRTVVYRAPRPEPEYQLGDIRLVTYKDHDPVEMVLTRAAANQHIWVAVDATTCAWPWPSRIPAASSYITAVELRPQDKPQTVASDPAPRMVADLREFPGRVALDKDGGPWTALPDSEVIVANAIVQDSEAELPVRWGPYRWADEASS